MGTVLSSESPEPCQRASSPSGLPYDYFLLPSTRQAFWIRTHALICRQTHKLNIHMHKYISTLCVHTFIDILIYSHTYFIHTFYSHRDNLSISPSHSHIHKPQTYMHTYILTHALILSHCMHTNAHSCPSHIAHGCTPSLPHAFPCTPIHTHCHTCTPLTCIHMYALTHTLPMHTHKPSCMCTLTSRDTATSHIYIATPTHTHKLT